MKVLADFVAILSLQTTQTPFLRCAKDQLCIIKSQ